MTQVAGTGRRELFQFLPVLSTEKASESCSEGGSFVARSVRMENKSALGRRQSRGFFVGQRTTYQCGCDIRNLISVYKSQSVLCRNGNTIENVQFRNLQDMLDCPELGIRGTEYGRTNG